VVLKIEKNKVSIQLNAFNVLSLNNKSMKFYLGNKVGIHATLEKADISGELIRASSDTPPDFDRGPTASTRHSISSLQKP
jgi:hypothetical protein